MPNTRAPELFKEGLPEEHLRELALILNEVLIGKTNNMIRITLDADSETTIIERDRVNIDTVVGLTPQTTSAAQVTDLWVETTYGRITVHHNSDAAEDRTFGAVLVG